MPVVLKTFEEARRMDCPLQFGTDRTACLGAQCMWWKTSGIGDGKGYCGVLKRND